MLPAKGTVGRFGVIAVLIWIAAEVVLRRGVVRYLADLFGSARGADIVILGVGFPLLAYGLASWGMRRGIGTVDWDYTVSARSVGIGVAGSIMYYVVFLMIAVGYAQLIGTPRSASVGAAVVESASETLWLAVGFFIANGMIVPIAEELAWRGVIQTSLMNAYGVSIGVILTTLAFALKHLVVDAATPLLRVVSLLLLAFLLCGLRAKYGTASSTVAHLVVNSISSAVVVFAAL